MKKFKNWGETRKCCYLISILDSLFIFKYMFEPKWLECMSVANIELAHEFNPKKIVTMYKLIYIQITIVSSNTGNWNVSHNNLT